MEYIYVMEYKQMAGRAGRPHLDPYGECVLVPGENDGKSEVEKVFNKYIYGTPEKIHSFLIAPKHLRIHILASIASEFVKTVPEFKELLDETFFAHQPEEEWATPDETKKYIDSVVNGALNYLIEEHMIIINRDGAMSATPLGKIVSRLCLNPTTAALIMKGFNEIDETGIEVTDMTLLHLISLTDDVETERHIKPSDYDDIMSVYHAHEKELVKFEELIKFNKLEWIQSSHDVIEPLKIADILRMWITEHKEAAIAECWNIAEGDVYSIKEQSNRVMAALYDIGRLYENERVLKLAGVLKVRLNEGIEQELIGLIKIRGIGRVFARRLYNAGINSEQKYEELKASDPDLVRSIMYPKKNKDNVSDATPEQKSDVPIPIPIKQPKLANRQKSIADY